MLNRRSFFLGAASVPVALTSGVFAFNHNASATVIVEIEKLMYEAVQMSMFKPNDLATRHVIRRFMNEGVQTILDKHSSVKMSVLTICDNRNNPPELIENNGLRVTTMIIDHKGDGRIQNKEIVVSRGSMWFSEMTS